MKQKQEERKPAIYGLATLRVTKKEVTVTMLANGKNHRKNDEFEFDREDIEIPVASGTFSVKLSGDGNRLWECYPVNSSFTTRFVGFGGKDAPTIWREQGSRVNKKGNPYNYDDQLCKALVEVVEGPEKGMVIPCRLYYDKLAEDDETGNVIVVGDGDRSQAWVDLFNCTGVWDAETEFSENVLVDLQKKMLKNKREFLTIVSDKGFVDKFAPLRRSTGAARVVRGGVKKSKTKSKK